MARYGFYITMGEFGSGKTQNTTAYLKWYRPSREINITNYYTGYSHFQVSSHHDLIAVLNDIYDYHQYVNLLGSIHKIYKHKQSEIGVYLRGFADFLVNCGDERMPQAVNAYIEHFRLDSDTPDYAGAFRNFSRLSDALETVGLYRIMKKGLKFNIVLDESSIYFNPRNFAVNFSGKNERLLDFIYQPRKLNVLMFVVVQSPMELDVKFRRLATYYRKYYKGLYFLRWHRDYYFLDPEEIDLQKAEQVGFGINLNFYPAFPRYDYDTKELIRPGTNIYPQGALFARIKEISPGSIPVRNVLPGWLDNTLVRLGWKSGVESDL